MRQHSIFWTFLHVFISLFHGTYAQATKESSLVRIYQDNDFINITGRGSDKAYSAGTRVDLFYEQKTRDNLLSRIFTTGNDTSVNIAGWGVMQTIFTPQDISNPNFQPDDYFYSAALFIIRSLYHYNSIRHQSFQTEIQLGVRGPSALGKQAQTFIHRKINDEIPRGWEHQLPNAPVINVNFTFEKQLTSVSKKLELITGGKIYLGTLRSGLTIAPQIRYGAMNPYFNGYISQLSGTLHDSAKRKNKLQAYIIIKPEVQLIFNNASIEKSLFPKKQQMTNNEGRYIRNGVYAISYGAVVSSEKLTVSLLQNTSTEMRRGTYSHEVGNISVCIIL